VRGLVVRGLMQETTAPYSPSPPWGEGRVRGLVVRGPRQTRVVCESPRDYARGLRHRQTDAERRVWARLRDRRLIGAKSARQVPIGERTVFLEALGYRVLRFWNNDALANTDGVLQRIAQALVARPSPRPSPQRGEGEGWE